MLASWESFYVIVGSAGGALIGLQFVVITLIAGRRYRAAAGSLGAFGTPTVVNLIGTLALAFGICGLGGLVYGALVFRRTRRQTDYEPVREDWLWYAVLPNLSYATLTVAAALLRSSEHRALFVVGAAALGLLLIGIHNAWDTVTHIVITTAGDGTTQD